MSLFNLVNNATSFDPHASNVRNLIKRLIGPMPIWTQWAEVKSVDKGNWTAVVEIQAEEQEYEDTVWLSPIEAGSQTAFVPVPKEGSMVIIMRLDATDWWTIVQCQELESLYMMGDKYGTVKAEDLVAELNKTKAVVDAFMNIMATWVQPTSPDSGVAASTLLTAIQTAFSPLQTGSYTNIINDDIRHGS